jgi:thiosulfate reductase cytochrome b subunit
VSEVAHPLADAPPAAAPVREEAYRHTRLVRATHWINALCVFFLFASGMQIFNAHPALHWGQKGFAYDKSAFIQITAQNRGGQIRGITRIAGVEFDTTGVLGWSKRPGGAYENRAFPYWLTIPSWHDLASGRRWHFFFAWIFVASGLVYLAHGLWSRHIQRDLAPTRDEVKPRHLLHEAVDHIRLRFPKGEAAKRYNALQKIAYFGTAIVLLPLMALTGMTMSPGLNAAAPSLLDVFGGRQSARTIHFICAALIALFILVHLVMVLISGVGNNLRSMITGRYRIAPEDKTP